METTNYKFKKMSLDDSPPDITATNPNWDTLDTELKQHDDSIVKLNESTENINEQLGEKVNYTDFTPIVTTGTASAYIATIPSTLTEVTIVPHINNLAGATLNSIPILDREGKPIGKDVLKVNIPTKLVRVGSNFFIASGSGAKGKLSANRWKIVPAISTEDAYSSDTILIGMNNKYVIYQVPYAINTRRYFIAVNRLTGDTVCKQSVVKDNEAGFFKIYDDSFSWSIIEEDTVIFVITNTSDASKYIAKWDLTTNEITLTHKFLSDFVYRLFKSEDGYIYGHNNSGTLAKISTDGTLLLFNSLGGSAYSGYLTEDSDYLYFYKTSLRKYIKVSKDTLTLIETIELTGSSWIFVQHRTFVQNGRRIIWDGSRINYFPQWNMQGNATYSISAKGVVGLNKDYMYITTGVLVRKVRLSDGAYLDDIVTRDVDLDTGYVYKYSDDNTFLTDYFALRQESDSSYVKRSGYYFEY